MLIIIFELFFEKMLRIKIHSIWFHRGNIYSIKILCIVIWIKLSKWRFCEWQENAWCFVIYKCTAVSRFVAGCHQSCVFQTSISETHKIRLVSVKVTQNMRLLTLTNFIKILKKYSIYIIYIYIYTCIRFCC